MKYGEYEEVMFRAEYPCASLEIAHQRAAEQRPKEKQNAQN